ncbi:MAG: cupin domain-containing protein [Muribaculaceae bacterium]|nr:cupin domain-containing protein [Muribaculaceae bacterium]
MQIILLSGGSGTRLWPLSNDARSKQFLKIIPAPDGSMESMIQRVVRQLNHAGLDAPVTIATGANQQDSVISQLGEAVNLVVEPSRRDTFPAICLACEFLARQKDVSRDEVVVVMPCDPFTEQDYFDAIRLMAKGVEDGAAQLVVMGINPTYPSAKYGYVLPATPAQADTPDKSNPVVPVREFIEKPDVPRAEALIREGALWNGGVFAFRLGFLLDLAEKYVKADSYEQVLANFSAFPKISFDYEVAEKASSVGMVRYNGFWKDLGTWNTLTDELAQHTFGNVVADETGSNTHVFNELGIPLLCLGTQNLIVAASPDGILVSEKGKSENIKLFAQQLKQRPMFEERRWGTYSVIDFVEFPNGTASLTKRLTLNPGCAISYQRHTHRDEIWNFIDGEGIFVLDGVSRPVTRGDSVVIPAGHKHTLKAVTPLTFIEVQNGSLLIEEDIERFPFSW